MGRKWITVQTDPSGSPDEADRIAVLLAESSFITGQTINPNAGLYMT
jgi:hypothetical protein